MAKNFYQKYFLILAAVAGVILLNKYVLTGFLPSGVYGVFEKPGIILAGNFGEFISYARGMLSSGFSLSRLIAENEFLKIENLKLIDQAARLQKIESENVFLRKQLAVEPKIQHPLLAAKVFSLNQNIISSTLLIDKGKADGVEKSMAVISAGNVLVGMVDEVFSNHSRVLLLDDGRSAVNVKIGVNNVIARAKGFGGGGGLILDLVTNQEEIKEGDSIITSGLDYLPEFLLIGRVSGVELKGGNLFKTVDGRLLYYPLTNPNLFVILK